MKISTIFFLLFYTTGYAQDGSDMRYIPIKKLNRSFIGKFAHIDFYRNSFGGLNVDTVIIKIDNIPVKFIEHRIDDGLNNWFSEQYLKSVDILQGLTIRINKCKIDSISRDSILVTNYYDYYDSNNNLLPQKSSQEKYWFKKAIIIEVLIKSKQFN